MKDLYYVFDESIKPKNQLFGIGCIIFDDGKVISNLPALMQSVISKRGIGNFRNKSGNPHYCEDNFEQRAEFLSKLKSIGCKGYIIFKKYDAETPSPFEMYKLLHILLEPLIRKFQKKPLNYKHRLIFEQGEGLSRHFLQERLHSTFDGKINFEIEIASKEDRNGVTCLPDYLLGVLLDFLVNTHSRDPYSTGNSNFIKIDQLLSLVISIEGDNVPMHHDISKNEGVSRFKRDYAGKYSIKS